MRRKSLADEYLTQWDLLNASPGETGEGAGRIGSDVEKVPSSQAPNCSEKGLCSPPDSQSSLPKLTESGSPDLFANGEEDLFLHDRMPKSIHWSVPWSDLMMTMFILFLVMYLYQSSNQGRLPARDMKREVGLSARPGNLLGAGEPGEFSGSQEASLARIYNLGRQTVKAKALESFASVSLGEDKAVRIILTGDLLFDTGEALLKPEAKKSLSEIAEIMKQTPYAINVVGHTDNVPIQSDQFPTNWELSAIRACVVTRFLIEEMEIPARRFFISGHSYHQAARPNDTVENRAANRRVEIIITKERPHGMAGGIGSFSSPGQLKRPAKSQWTYGG